MPTTNDHSEVDTDANHLTTFPNQTPFNPSSISRPDDADQLQARILKRLRAVKSTGLGDREEESWTIRLAPSHIDGSAWRGDHIRVLHEIRENIGAMRQRWIQALSEH